MRDSLNMLNCFTIDSNTGKYMYLKREGEMVGVLRFSFDFMIITRDLCSTCISRVRARPSSAWTGAPRAAQFRTKPAVSNS